MVPIPPLKRFHLAAKRKSNILNSFMKSSIRVCGLLKKKEYKSVFGRHDLSLGSVKYDFLC